MNDDLQKRITAMDQEMKALLDKYELVALPIMVMSQHGIIPQLQFVDKAEFEKRLHNATAPVSEPLKG